MFKLTMYVANVGNYWIHFISDSHLMVYYYSWHDVLARKKFGLI